MALAIKRFMLGLLLVMLVVPAMQAKFHFVEEAFLHGASPPSEHPEFSWAALRRNDYQPSLEKYLEDRLGLRSHLIRLRNQLSFSLFRSTHASGIAVGRGGILFEIFQAQSYTGHDRLAEAVVRSRVRRLRTVQRDLARRGVLLLFVMAPNKPRFQPEDLPTGLQAAPGTVANYDLYIREMRADTVAFLDMVPLFARWKKTLPYPLFARVGTHWSGYGATLAADTLLRRLAHMGNVRFPAVRTVGPPLIVRAVDSLQGNDNDLAKPLNLLQNAANTPHAYRRLAFAPPQPGETRPPALFVGDSFTWGLIQFRPYLLHEFSDDTRLWYYGNNVHLVDSLITYTGWQCQRLDLRKEVESRRFIVLVVTEHNLIKQEFGFTDHVYQLYHPYSEADKAAINQIAQHLMDKDNARNADAAWAAQAKDGNAYWEQMHQQAEDMYDQKQEQQRTASAQKTPANQ